MAATKASGSSNRASTRRRTPAQTNGSGPLGSRNGSSACSSSARSSATRGRSGGSGANGSAPRAGAAAGAVKAGGASKRSRRKGGASRSRSAKPSSAKPSGSRAGAGAGKTASGDSRSAPSRSSENGGGSVRETITHVLLPAVTGAVGVAGGVLLGRTALQRNRKVLGIPIPGVKVDMGNVSKNLGEAGRQFGRLASEIQSAREKAEKISKAIG